jgi:uroporphyrinogen-III synthase
VLGELGGEINRLPEPPAIGDLVPALAGMSETGVMTASSRPARIWVTRAQPGADATAQRLRALGFAPVVAPVLETAPRADAVIDLTGVVALAFTSAAALAAFAALCPAREATVFTVGDATAEAARAAGFTDVRSADGDALALAGLIATASAGQPSGLVLCPTAAEPAADLPALLAARGVQAGAVVVYKSVQTAPAPTPADLAAVLVHSPKAARIIAARLDPAQSAGMTLVAISQAAAAPLAALPFADRRIAPRPSEAALLALLAGDAG